MKRNRDHRPMNDQRTQADGSRILRLTLNKRWFDLIASGQKQLEYREYKDYWKTRLLKKNTNTGFTTGTVSFDRVHFTNGYGKDRPIVVRDFLGCLIMNGKSIVPDNGEPIDPDLNYFVILLGKIRYLTGWDKYDYQA